VRRSASLTCFSDRSPWGTRCSAPKVRLVECGAFCCPPDRAPRDSACCDDRRCASPAQRVCLRGAVRGGSKEYHRHRRADDAHCRCNRLTSTRFLRTFRCRTRDTAQQAFDDVVKIFSRLPGVNIDDTLHIEATLGACDHHGEATQALTARVRRAWEETCCSAAVHALHFCCVG
jgi:hypothetical protein